MRSARGAVLRLSRADRRMDVRRYRVPLYGLSGGHPVGRIGIHIHVDIGGSVSGSTQASALRNGANKNAVNCLISLKINR